VALTIHDPGRIGLRRGIRAAVAMPVVLAITLFVLDDQKGAVYAGFGTAGLLITADYAGSWQRRLTSYLLTGVVGTVVLVVGLAASRSTATAVAVTAVVAFLLAFVSLLRGLLAVGSPAVLLVFIVAVTLGGDQEQIAPDVTAWWVAVIVSTIAALFVFPHDVRTDIRDALADSFAAAADVAQSAWLGVGPSPADEAVLEPLAHALDKLNATYDGKPFRPTGASQRDQALTLLVSTMNSARLLLAGTVDTLARREALPPIDGRREMAVAVTDMLRQLSRAVRDPSFAPTAAGLDRARDTHQRASEAWVLDSARAGVDAETVAGVVRDDHLLRMAALLTEQMAALGRQLNGFAPEDLDAEPPIPQRPWSTVMVAHLNLHSPWLRNAVRTAVGLAIAVLVVELTGVQHGFWVLLGVLSVLRYDLTATTRTAALAIAGTVIGVVAATGVILLVGPHSAVLWALLPVAVFLAAWAPIATSYPIGQAAFTGFILLILGIIDWPPDLMNGLVRIEDILIGVGVAVVVGLLMWPRGAIGALNEEIAHGLRACSAYLSSVIDALVDVVPPSVLSRDRLDARTAAERASETYDMAIMQRGSTVREGTTWAELANASHLLLAVGRILGVFATDPPILAGSASNVSAVTAAREASDRRWAAIAEHVESSRTVPDAPRIHDHRDMPLPIGVDDPASAHAYVVCVWTVNWVDHLNRLSPRTADPVTAGSHAG
jgi:uncharacterized membrane protein YccC